MSGPRSGKRELNEGIKGKSGLEEHKQCSFLSAAVVQVGAQSEVSDEAGVELRDWHSRRKTISKYRISD